MAIERQKVVAASQLNQAVPETFSVQSSLASKHTCSFQIRVWRLSSSCTVPEVFGRVHYIRLVPDNHMSASVSMEAAISKYVSIPCILVYNLGLALIYGEIKLAAHEYRPFLLYPSFSEKKARYHRSSITVVECAWVFFFAD